MARNRQTDRTPKNEDSDKNPASGTGEHLRGWRRWAFPLISAVAVPLLLLAGLELGLRLAGYGVPASFWLPADEMAALEGAPPRPGEASVNGGGGAPEAGAWAPNPRFGWRFFPPAIARTPVVAKVARERPEDTLRLVVIGGSAAQGTPDAAFGFPRVLEVMLEEAYPELDFEVVNAAMTAIGSHVALPVALESLERLEPDALLVYLGNNEVVGPYGPGTVFAGFSDSLTAIRWSVWLSGTRTGQLIRRVAGGLGDREATSEWRGLEMFQGRRIGPDDPRLEAVYSHLQANLEDLLAAARHSGVPVLLSTVATNLADNPPFASVHREGLSEEDERRWQESFDRGVELLDAAESRDDVGAALEAFRAAEELDDSPAELHFYLAHAHRLLGETEEARRRWVAARDADALRFRADSRINRVIRAVAGGEDSSAEEGSGDDGSAEEDAGGDGSATPPAVLLVDGEAAVAGPDGPPGAGVFWEHVHLNPEGNYRLARAFFEQLARIPPLAASTGAEGAGPQPPSRERAGELLALTAWDRHRMLETIVAMTDRPPFTGQLGHGEVQRQRRLLEADLRVAARSSLDRSEELYRAALERRPGDLQMRAHLAELLEERGDPEAALEQWDLLLEALPGVAPWRSRRAFVLARLGRRDLSPRDPDPRPDGAPSGDVSAGEGTPGPNPLEDPRIAEAVEEMEALRDAHRRSPEAWLNLAAVLEDAGLGERAESVYRRTIERFPGYEPARLNLGNLLAEAGELEAAEEVYRRAAEDFPASPDPRGRLAQVLERRGEMEEAEEQYRRALELDPGHSVYRNNLGYLLERLQRPEEALEAYRQAIDADPSYPLPYFNLADLLLGAGQAGEATRLYRAGLTLEPANLQGRYNLAVALAGSGQPAAAAEQFRVLLEVAPGHPGALNNLAWLLVTGPQEMREPARAVELARRASEIAPDNPQVLETLARAYAAAGRRADARATARRAVEAARGAGRAELARTLEGRLEGLL